MKTHKRKRQRFAACAMAMALFIFFPAAVSAQFTSGSLVVLQANNGVGSQTNTGNPVVLKEFSTGGVPGYSLTVPVTGTNALVISGSAGSEGYLSLSADNKYLVFGGYAQSLPNATPLPGATASAVNRGIGMVSGTGSYSLVAVSASFFSTGNIRGAAAAGNTKCWGTGSSQGINFFGPGGTPVTVQNGKTNLRAVHIFNGQLYCSAQVASGTPTNIGIYQVGSGTPTVAGQTVSCIITTGTGSAPNQFFFNSSNTICYVADGRNSALGGVQKWVNSAGTWSLAYTLHTGTAAVGAFGVAADFSGGNPMVYATTSEGSGANRLVAIADVGAAATATTIAVAPSANTNFRGLAFSPCTVPVLTVSGNSNLCAGQTLSLSVSATVQGPFAWSGQGAFSAASSASTVVSGAASGMYTVSAANACGVTEATFSVTVHPLPAVTAPTVMVCTGQPATLTAGGAASYAWSTGSTLAAIVVIPAAGSAYTVTGTSAQGCVKTVTTQVVTATTPDLTVNAPPFCSGTQATLTAGGANSFTWSTGALSSSIVIAPAAITGYTVSGSLAGCTGIASLAVVVPVLPSPTPVISGGTLTCAGTHLLLSATGADTYAWSNGIMGNVNFVTPSVTSVYTVTGTNNNGCTAAASHTVAVGSGPLLSISGAGTVACVYSGPASYTAGGAITYSWSTGTTGAVLDLTLTATGVHTFVVTGYLGPNCFSSKQLIIRAVPCAGIPNQPAGGEALSVYPNPAGGHVSIDFNAPAPRLVSLVNAAGTTMLECDTSAAGIDINTGNYPKGMYLIRITSAAGNTYKKLLIE